jgi:hypothetical protein
MRRRLMGMVVLGLLVVGGPAVPDSGGGADAEARWLTDYAAARQAARTSGKPIFVVFR